MKLLFRLAILYAALFFPLAAQQEISVNPPDPADLEVSWWRYFEDEEKLEERTEQLISELEELKKSLTEKRAQVLKNEIERLTLLLKEFKAIKQEELEYKPTSPLYLEKYYLSDWLKISQKIRLLNQEIEEIRSENNKIQAEMDAFRQNLDLFQIHYRLLEGSPSEKIQLGIEIMRTRLEIGLLESMLKKNKKLVALMEADRDKLKDEKAFAQENLNFSNLDPAVQKKKLTEARALHQKADAALLEAEKEKTHKDLSGPESELAELKVLEASIEAEQAETQILFQQILLQLSQKEIDTEAIGKEITDWNRKLRVIENKTESWTDLLETIEVQESSISGKVLKKRQDTKVSLGELQSSIEDTNLLILQLERSVVEESSTLWKVINWAIQSVNSLWTHVTESISFTLFRINDYPVTPWILLRSLLIIVFSIMAGRILLRFIRSSQKVGMKIGRGNLYTIAKIAYYSIVIFGFVFAFFSIGFDVTNFVIIAGALGVGVGLGLQSIVNNFFTGIVLLFEKRLRIGDIIDIDGEYKGRVKSINILNTHIRTFDGRDVIVPNSDFLTKRLVNWTMKDTYIRLQIPFGVAYDADVELVKKIILKAARGLPNTVTEEAVCPPPQVWMTELGDNALLFELAVWVDLRTKSSTADLQSEYLLLIEKTLRENDIEMPFPQTDIWIRKVPDELSSSKEN